MSLSISRFEEFFRACWGYAPFPWQTRLAKQVFDKGWPECIDLPTASGKTACIDIAVFVLGCQADRPTNERTVGRRVFFTVNRRVIVDEAFDRAKALAQRLLDATGGILKEVADALREISGDERAPPLDVAELRGGIYRDRAWARSITQPIIVCTTADQLGSRLLFRGYGVSQSMQPVHAALTGCDSLVLLDEAHVTRAFCQTMRLLTKYRQVRTDGAAPILPLRFVEMTATPAGEVTDRFELDGADRSHPILQARQEASKPATLVKLDKKKPLAPDIVSRAFDALSDTRKAVGIIVNRVHTAREIEGLIRKEVDKRAEADGTFRADVHLVIGRMRPIDRDDLQDRLRALVGPGRPDTLEYPVFVVATQCLEVGADYDFDALFTECASIDALRQRVGRLNRKGRKNRDRTPFQVSAAIITNEESLKGDDPIYGDAIKHTWEWLWSNKNEKNQVDFGIAGFNPLWRKVEKGHATYLDEDCPRPLLSPTQNAAVLLPAHLDALCQTGPHPVPSPDVSYFIHGARRDMAEVSVCWRADLGEDATLWPEIVRLLPPTSPECMTVPLWEVRRWMRGDPGPDRDADVPVPSADDEQAADRSSDQAGRRVVVWRFGRKPGGGETRSRLVGFVTGDPDDLSPGDTLMMPVKDRSWNELGHIPGHGPADYQKHGDEPPDKHSERCRRLDRSVDVAERATRQARLRVVVRIHPAFENTESLRGLSDHDLRQVLVDRDIIPAAWKAKPVARIERHPYHDSDDGSSGAAPDEVIVFKRLLDPPNALAVPPDDEDDGEDNLSERDGFVSLGDHTRHVIDRIGAALGRLGVNGLEPTLCASARLHDLGKADVRFQALLAGITPYEAMMRPMLGKGDGRRVTAAERRAAGTRALIPAAFRHEMLSVQIVENGHADLVTGTNIDLDLLLHLIAAHHGHARPFSPVCLDEPAEDDRRNGNIAAFAERRSICIKKSDIHCPEVEITGEQRGTWTPVHRLDSGVAERFWTLTRRHGWWGLAWLESLLRLADQQASAAEQEDGAGGKPHE